jgi:hypothetical protein
MVIVQRDWTAFLQQSDFWANAPQVQLLFLQDAMVSLSMDRDTFALRIGVSKSALDKWMSPRSSKEFRTMSRMAWQYITEILEGCELVH